MYIVLVLKVKFLKIGQLFVGMMGLWTDINEGKAYKWVELQHVIISMCSPKLMVNSTSTILHYLFCALDLHLMLLH